MNKEIRTRFAPSPTGYVHIGNLRTALYAYLLAKNNNGKFLLRVEDTDQKRFVEGSLEKILDALDWAGIEIDEGVKYDESRKVAEEGEWGPYFQSKRLEIYHQHVQKLLDSGHAYHCFCSTERLEKVRKIQQDNKQAPKYDKYCATLSQEEVEQKIKAGEKYVIRMNVPRGECVFFHDEVYGKIVFKSDDIDDQVLIKSDGFPTYHFAVVVDDHLMNISHVVRGEDWLPSAPKHALLYKFFGWEMPVLVHVPNVLNENKKKLSKRQGDVTVEDFQKKGYLPEALVNFLALLGWNPKTEQEHFSMEALIKIFDVSGLHKAGAVFDYKKLDWMNSYYIKQKTNKELFDLTKPILEKYCKEKEYVFDEDLLEKITKIEKDRMKTLMDVVDNVAFYFIQNDYDSSLLHWKENTKEQTVTSLKKAKEIIVGIDDENFEVEEIEKLLMRAAGEKRGDLLWPLRVALTGERKSPSPFELAWALGKKESLERIEKAIEKIS